jgi:hypothetical protein
MKKVSILIAFVLLLGMPFSSFAQSNTLTTINQDIDIDYSNYDLNDLEQISQLYANNVEFQNLVKQFTEEKINMTINEAVKKSKNKKDKNSNKINVYLEKLKELNAIDSNFKLKTASNTPTITFPSINQQNQLVYATSTRIGTFDLKGKCKTNAAIIANTYSTNFALGMIIYPGNAITAAAYAYSATGISFASKVKTGGEWDYKQFLGWNNLYYVIIGTTTYTIKGEDIGNFHYGYTGAVIFADTVLLSAAGLVQIVSGTAHMSYYASYFDDPNDQFRIRQGISCYKDKSL